jgi:hypothetical protein
MSESNILEKVTQVLRDIKIKKQKKCRHPESKRYIIRGGYAMGYIEWRCLKCGMEFEESDQDDD